MAAPVSQNHTPRRDDRLEPRAKTLADNGVGGPATSGPKASSTGQSPAVPGPGEARPPGHRPPPTPSPPPPPRPSSERQRAGAPTRGAVATAAGGRGVSTPARGARAGKASEGARDKPQHPGGVGNLTRRRGSLSPAAATGNESAQGCTGPESGARRAGRARGAAAGTHRIGRRPRCRPGPWRPPRRPRRRRPRSRSPPRWPPPRGRRTRPGRWHRRCCRSWLRRRPRPPRAPRP